MAGPCNLFIALCRFRGVPYALKIVTATKRDAIVTANRVMSRRNADVKTERSELMCVYAVGVDEDISGQKADEIWDACYKKRAELRRRGIAAPDPEDIDPDDRNRIFHVPLTDDEPLIAVPR